MPRVSQDPTPRDRFRAAMRDVRVVARNHRADVDRFHRVRGEECDPTFGPPNLARMVGIDPRAAEVVDPWLCQWSDPYQNVPEWFAAVAGTRIPRRAYPADRMLP